MEYLLREWVRLYHQPAAGKESEKAFSTFVAMVRYIEKLRLVMVVKENGVSIKWRPL